MALGGDIETEIASQPYLSNTKGGNVEGGQ